MINLFIVLILIFFYLLRKKIKYTFISIVLFIAFYYSYFSYYLYYKNYSWSEIAVIGLDFIIYLFLYLMIFFILIYIDLFYKKQDEK